MKNVFADHDELKRSMDIQTKLEFQNYLSQTFLTYLSEEFLKILKIPWTLLMFARPSILLGIMVSSIEESKRFSLFFRNCKTIIFLWRKPL